MKYPSHQNALWRLLAASVCLAVVFAFNIRAADKRATTTEKKAEETEVSDEKKDSKKKKVIIESIEKDDSESKAVTWLGISTEEAPEALASQLGLSSGEGLIVNYVADESPAAKAGLKKYDVLVELDDQMLVHPSQLRKLVRMHKDGDKVKVTIYRSGKKETISATLGKRTERVGMLLRDPSIPFQLHELGRDLKLHLGEDVHGQMKELQEALALAGVDRDKLQVEIKRSLDEAHKGIAEALYQTRGHLQPMAKEIEELVRRGVNLDKDASVIVKSDRKSVKTVVKTDDTGTYVIIATPRKRLTAHDKDGKLVFDGEIETTAQQEKVPSEVWEQVKPMLDKLDSRKSNQLEDEE